MSRSPTVVRASALVVLAAVAIHELRLRIGFDDGDEELIRDEQAYLSLGLALTGVLALAGTASFLRSLHRARRSGRTGPEVRPGFAVTWLLSSAVLIAVYSVHELLEGLLAEGHPAGIAGIVGHAGWAALLLAVVFGALIAWALRSAQAAIVRAAARRAACRRLARRMVARRRRPEPRTSGRSVLALRLAGRAPPLSPS